MTNEQKNTSHDQRKHHMTKEHKMYHICTMEKYIY